MKKLVLFLAFAACSQAQIPAPQLNLTGNIGCQGFPCLNSGTIILSADANHTMTPQETSAFSFKVTSTLSLTATRNIIFPSGTFALGCIENATTGGQIIQVIGSSGSGVPVPNGAAVCGIWNDGTNFVTTLGSTGISGGTANCIPVYGTPTTITGCSHADDGETTAGIITSAEPVRAPQYLNSGGSPAVSLGTGSGSTGRSYTFTGTSTDGEITIQIGSSPAANGIIADITTNPIYPSHLAYCVVTPASANSVGTFYAPATSGSGSDFQIIAVGTLTATNVYFYNFHCGGN